MRLIRLYITLLLLSVVTIIGGCNRAPEGTGPVIATVNGDQIRESDYQAALRAQFGTNAARSDAERKHVIDLLIKRKLLVQEAQKQKLDEKDEVAQAIRFSHDELLIRAMTLQYMKDNPITGDEVKQRYEELKKEREYNLSHILLPSEAEAIKTIGEIKGGKSFTAIAKASSLDVDSGKRGGKIGWVTRHSLAPELFFAAEKLKDGGMTATPVKSEFGWHVALRHKGRNTQLPPYDKVKDRMLQLVQQERLERLTKHLRESANVVVTDTGK